MLFCQWFRPQLKIRKTLILFWTPSEFWGLCSNIRHLVPNTISWRKLRRFTQSYWQLWATNTHELWVLVSQSLEVSSIPYLTQMAHSTLNLRHVFPSCMMQSSASSTRLIWIKRSNRFRSSLLPILFPAVTQCSPLTKPRRLFQSSCQGWLMNWPEKLHWGASLWSHSMRPVTLASYTV